MRKNCARQQRKHPDTPPTAPTAQREEARARRATQDPGGTAHPAHADDAARPVRLGRLAQLRKRWRNASLKTSFMGYMLIFLVAALVLSITTGALFGSLQNEATADAYEMSGLYLYDEADDTLVPARTVELDASGSSLFVETVRDSLAALPRVDLPATSQLSDASDYAQTDTASGLEEILSGSISDATPISGDELDASNLEAYDAQARKQFAAWASRNPESPFAAYAQADGAQGGSSSEAGLLASPIGYYLHTPPSAEARALATLFGFLTFLMFPLWFGICIFAAARRFYRMRLAPGFSTLDAAAAKIAEQDLDFAVAYDRNDEMGRLAASFETMRASLADSQRTLWRTAEERKRLNAAFAHDLRTPLTILKGKIELLDAHVQANDASAEQLAASTASLATQVERLERYVSAMSGLQKLEDRTPQPTEHSFDEVAGALEEIAKGLAASSDIACTLSISAHCDQERPLLAVDRAFVEEAAENLVGNALRYAAARIEVRVDVRDGFLSLTVEDDGPGFSPEALAQGCAPFFSETPSKDHFGLGLNITALLCDKHGGSLRLDNKSAGGARATARFAMILPVVGSR